MRTLAIDLGTKRVGLALSDEGGTFATPYEVIEVTTGEAVLAAIVELVRREAVRRIVLGMPLNMDDSLGPAAKQTLDWGKRLAGLTGLGVIYVDERLSSFEAEQQLITRKRGGEKMTRQGRRRRLDALAAAGFLQAYLDGRLPPLEL